MVGCYKSAGSLELMKDIEYNSNGACGIVCVEDDVAAGNLGYSVLAMSSKTKCYCGNKLPSSSDKVDDDKCSMPCPGYDLETCKCSVIGGGIVY